MNEDELKVTEEAKAYIKKEKRSLLEKFCDTKKFPPVESPFTLFMAGSPGAGKTEFSKRLLESLLPTPIVRIDADEIRDSIPQYTGKNSNVVQGAASIMVDNINYHTLKHRQNAIMDGTFSHYTIAHRNIENCIRKKRDISIFYVYQDPFLSPSPTVRNP